MNFFKIKTSWSNLELGLLKVCVGSIYMAAGVYFHAYLHQYLLLFISIFIITALWAFTLWWRKMKSN